MERVFLGFDTPFIDASIELILKDQQPSTELDLRDTSIVLPTRRSARLFLDRIVTICQEQGLRLVTPPRILTPGSFLVQVLGDEHCEISDAVSLFIWQQVLETHTETLKPLLRKSPVPTGYGEWLSLARQFLQLRVELYGNGLTFAAVAEKLESDGLEREVERWETLCTLESEYLNVVEQVGLQDPLTGRITMLDSAVIEGAQLYLIGCAELPGLVKLLLERTEVSVTVCVAAENC